MKVEFTSFPKCTNWTSGIVNDGEYTFDAKLFDSGSRYGIDGGRVSKLLIKRGDHWIVHYDRGWDVEVSNDSDREVFEAVMGFLEKSPARFE